LADYCSCGAQLPPDALFCHKCGKPQREIVEPEPVAPPPQEPAFVPPPPEVKQFPPPGFRNPVAMRIALIAAISATLLGFIFSILACVVAGFLAVYFYRRATGDPLNVRGGVKLGWLTGVLMFAPWSVISTIQMVEMKRSGKLAAALEDQLSRTIPAGDPSLQRALDFLQSGPGLTLALAFSLFLLFCFITGLSMAGGALGAKLGGRSS
jgi:hypothetical protein